MKKTKEKNHAALAREKELIVKELDDEVLVYDLERDKAHCLNYSAAFVWKHCDGQRSVDEIARLMEKEWRTPVNEDAVWFALNKLSKADLLQERVDLPEAKAGISRRSAVRRLAFGSLLIPAVISIVAPTALAGASVPPACQQCVKKKDGIQDCPSECTGAVLGTCYSNSGCGSGQDCACVSCQTCFSGATSCGSGSISWEAPGVRC